MYLHGWQCSEIKLYVPHRRLTNAHMKVLYGLGITASVNESTLSRANENRDYRIYEGLGQALIKQVQPLYSKMRLEYRA